MNKTIPNKPLNFSNYVILYMYVESKYIDNIHGVNSSQVSSIHCATLSCHKNSQISFVKYEVDIVG